MHPFFQTVRNRAIYVLEIHFLFPPFLNKWESNPVTDSQWKVVTSRIYHWLKKFSETSPGTKFPLLWQLTPRTWSIFLNLRYLPVPVWGSSPTLTVIWNLVLHMVSFGSVSITSNRQDKLTHNPKSSRKGRDVISTTTNPMWHAA